MSSTVPQKPPRSIVLCFDGTNGQYGSMNTNVVKFFGLLHKDCPDQQVSYYQSGLGTYFAPGVVSPLWLSLASLMDKAVAWYLDAHVMAGYKFLMENYRTGDKICLFGFSRGAYTARALAGMLEKVGLLPKGNIQQISFAYKAYTRTDDEGVKLAAGFKQTFSQDVKVEFVGVWDTVESTGMLLNRELPFTASNDAIKMFRHALSLDEHRSRFRPNLFHWPPQVNEGDGAIGLEGAVKRMFNVLESMMKWLFNRKSAKVPQQTVRSESQRADESSTVSEEASAVDVLEVWFAGCHSDIGGGNVQDNVHVSLAQITLHWMVEQVIQSQCGIVFDNDQLARIGFVTPSSSQSSSNHKSPLQVLQRNKDGSVVEGSPNFEPTPSSNPYPEPSHVAAPLFNELKRNRLWWILEIMPFTYTWQDDNKLKLFDELERPALIWAGAASYLARNRSFITPYGKEWASNRSIINREQRTKMKSTFDHKEKLGLALEEEQLSLLHITPCT